MPSPVVAPDSGSDDEPRRERVLVVAGEDGGAAARQARALTDGTGRRTAVWVGTAGEPALDEMVAEIGGPTGAEVATPAASPAPTPAPIPALTPATDVRAGTAEAG